METDFLSCQYVGHLPAWPQDMQDKRRHGKEKEATLLLGDYGNILGEPSRSGHLLQEYKEGQIRGEGSDWVTIRENLS